MKKLALFLSKEKSLGWIIAIGAALRLLFVFIGGPIYYGHGSYFIQADTSSWFDSFINLLEHGTFTVNSSVEAGKFYRPPGYSFLFGIFYLAAFKNFALAWKMLVAVQVLMDITSIYLIARIAGSVVKNDDAEKKTAFSNLSALLYAFYPFAIIWAPVLYAETSSIFFLLLSIHFAFRKPGMRNIFLSGLFGGIATLIRLQCAFAVATIVVVLMLRARKNSLNLLHSGAVFSFAVLITYGLWPARNYIFQHRVMFTQDLHIGGVWSEDFMSFLDYAHSISTDHTPIYLEILKNEKVNWPPQAYLHPSDSVLLDSAVNLCRTCGTGFAIWKWVEHLAPSPLLQVPSCDTAIAGMFNTLYLEQKKENPFHYWVTIPFQNLAKCFFKFSLYGNKSAAVKLFSSMLFIFRSSLLLLGLLGVYLAYKSDFIEKYFLLFVTGYMAVWYFYLSFFYRNMEMRYLLQTDLLMLIPAAYVCLLLIPKKPREGT